MDYKNTLLGGARIAQYSSAHQHFSGIFVPILSRYLWVKAGGKGVAVPSKGSRL
jgi:hypothetical protein